MTASLPATDTDAVIVGAGFAGIYAAYKLRELGLTIRLFERGSGVGGTWYWNRYPGARCDAPSMQYSYTFSEDLQQDWEWSEYYATQPEIERYLNHVTDRFQLRDVMQFNTTVSAARFDEEQHFWTVETESGAAVTARFVVMGTGCLSSRNTPGFDGLDAYEGEWYHTGYWPKHAVDFAGKTVGIVGTGSSGIQAIPVVAQACGHLQVFQRTPQFSTPARNMPMDKDYETAIKSEYAAYRARNYRNPVALDLVIDRNAPKTFEVSDEQRRQTYEQCWKKGGLSFTTVFRDSSLNLDANESVSQFIRDKISEVVSDPVTAAALKPKHIYACKRPCIDTDYYETYNRDNVTLVDVSATGVERISARGIIANGEEHPLDMIIFATGFDAFTGALNQIDIQGRGGQRLKDRWRDGPRSYLGVQTAGFPNLFTITGPGSPSVLANMVIAIEQHVNFIVDCIQNLNDTAGSVVEADMEAENAWIETVADVASRTLYLACDNWYQGANIPGKPRGFVPYVDWPSYVTICEDVAASNYRGFRFS